MAASHNEVSGAFVVVGLPAVFNSSPVWPPSALDSLLGFPPVTSSTITLARRTLVLHEVSSLRHSATVILHPQSQPSLLARARMVACCSSVKEARSISGIDLNEVTFGFAANSLSPAFNSSLVLPPCLRRRAMISVCLNPLLPQFSDVLPALSFALISAPLAISSSAISL